ncbi:MAG: penicillin-binding protein 2 [Gammaproteobacteria bacterium]|jgi:penicillin-binding protein 2
MQQRTHLKDHLRETHSFTNRVVIALVCVGLLLGVVIVRLVYLQIVNHEHFATLSENNRVNIVPVPPTRGLIFDRNGVLLAQNLPSFSLEIIPEQTDNLESTLKGLRKLIAISDDDLDSFRKRLQQKRPFESIPLRFRLGEDEVARFAVNRYRFPGVDVQARLTRDYPFGKIASHTIGYVGRINEEELNQVDPSNYSGTTHIGKTGVEKSYENILHGTVGYQHEESNARGRVLRVLQRIPPKPGENLYLTIDMDLQTVAESSLEGKRGALVAINPKTGEVLAMVSAPGVDPNLFVNGISSRQYQALQDDIDQPLFNRALTGQYPPGSTIKPFMALAGLEYKEVTPATQVLCQGSYSLPGDSHRYRDWKRGGHGFMNVTTAIMHSCDVYFYQLAHDLGIDRMHKYLHYFGFGQKTGVDLPGELGGLLPSREWKKAARHEVWYPGETLISGIGQGYDLITPMQLAEATAILANRGTIVQPHVVHATQVSGAEPEPEAPVARGKVPIASSKNWDTVISAMEDAANKPTGTAYRVGHGAPYLIAAKTGTAQVFGIKQNERYKAKDVEERLRDHALFIAFAPADDPEIAVAVVVENGGHGGSAAGPIARAVMDRYFSSKPAS